MEEFFSLIYRHLVYEKLQSDLFSLQLLSVVGGGWSCWACCSVHALESPHFLSEFFLNEISHFSCLQIPSSLHDKVSILYIFLSISLIFFQENYQLNKNVFFSVTNHNITQFRQNNKTDSRFKCLSCMFRTWKDLKIYIGTYTTVLYDKLAVQCTGYRQNSHAPWSKFYLCTTPTYLLNSS